MISGPLIRGPESFCHLNSQLTDGATTRLHYVPTSKGISAAVKMTPAETFFQLVDQI